MAVGQHALLKGCLGIDKLAQKLGGVNKPSLRFSRGERKTRKVTLSQEFFQVDSKNGLNLEEENLEHSNCIVDIPYAKKKVGQ